MAAITTSTDQLLVRLKDTKCEFLIMDISMPMQKIASDFALLSYIRRHYPSVHLIVLTMNMMPAVIYQIIKCGVHGVLHMNDDIVEIGEVIEVAARKSRYIGSSVRAILRAGPVGRMPTEREVEVLRMYA
ncbi:MAG: response regulator transcription factor [Glaciimonas sp.]|nr:response regulator transcription factor [Glaciimonas sp.]